MSVNNCNSSASQLGLFSRGCLNVLLTHIRRRKLDPQAFLNLVQISDKALEENTDGHYNNRSVTHTHADNNAWWQVDLTATESIANIQLFNRTDCCTERLRDFYVLVSDTPFGSRSLNELLADGSIWRKFHPGVAASNSAFAVEEYKGRYVRVQLNHADHLSLAEVQVNVAVE